MHRDTQQLFPHNPSLRAPLNLGPPTAMPRRQMPLALPAEVVDVLGAVHDIRDPTAHAAEQKRANAPRVGHAAAVVLCLGHTRVAAQRAYHGRGTLAEVDEVDRLGQWLMGLLGFLGHGEMGLGLCGEGCGLGVLRCFTAGCFGELHWRGLIVGWCESVVLPRDFMG